LATKKAEALKQRLNEIQKELAALQKFRKTKQRDQFIRQLVGERSHVKRQLSRQFYSFSKKSETKRERQRRLAHANKQRSVKMIRSWNYYRAIQKNELPSRYELEATTISVQEKQRRPWIRRRSHHFRKP
jgi:hypothetical protein